MAAPSLICDLLTCLYVPHTRDYSDSQFEAMPFPTLFGLTKLLERYGVDTEALHIADKSEFMQLTAPFIADMKPGLVIVTAVTPQSVSYLTQGNKETMPTADFLAAWTGDVLLVFPRRDAREPGYTAHHVIEVADKVKRWLLVIAAIALFAYLFVSNGIYRHVSTVLVTAIDLAGLWLTFMLVQKSLNIKNKAADAVCGVLQEGGCDHVLSLKASSFFGIFKWSEVGLAYFSVSLLCLLIFPEWIGYLALCNALCLPFTVWSIWYQKFRAHTWCTLCVSVQASLWLLFFCYLGGGWFEGIWPLRIEFFVLGVSYVTVLLAIDRLSPLFDRTEVEYGADDVGADSVNQNR